MNKEIITKTEQSLARIFAICDGVANSGQTIRTQKEGEEAAKEFFGIANQPSMPRNDLIFR